MARAGRAGPGSGVCQGPEGSFLPEGPDRRAAGPPAVTGAVSGCWGKVSPYRIPGDGVAVRPLAPAAWDDRPVTRTAERDRCLEELERDRDRWPAPRAGASRLAVTVHALRRRPVGELSAEDLRLMIGQDVGLAHLLPLAVEIPQDDPMAQGDLYEGDLLSAVLSRKSAAWNELPGARRELRVIVSGLTGLPPGLAREAERFLAR